jgi:hypothetical protein
MSLPKDYTYKPLPTYLKMNPSPIHGMGIFSFGLIPKGTILPISHRTDGCEVIRQDYGGWINHSDEPNCILSPVKKLDTGELVICADTKTNLYAPVLLRDIEGEQEITLDYSKSICGY